jgi:hypothetical protein
VATILLGIGAFPGLENDILPDAARTLVDFK